MGETRQRNGSTDDHPTEPTDTTEITVEVRRTGHVRSAVGTGRLTYRFSGRTLREFLDSFFAEYDVRDMLIADTEAEETTRGWAPDVDELPGKYAKNPEGEQTRRYARVVVNWTFNEHLDGLDTELTDGDRVALVYQFITAVESD